MSSACQVCRRNSVGVLASYLQLQRTSLCYCGVNWVLQTCPELVDTSTWTGEPATDGLIEKVMTAVPALSAAMVNERVVVG
jgi:hypothetical protein